MAKLEVISSGSFGNSYILSTENENLLIELGVNWERIIKKLDYERGFRKVVGCLVSHRATFRPLISKYT